MFFTYLYAPTVLGMHDRAAQEHAGADGARRAGDPPGASTGGVLRAAGIAWNTEVERRFVTSHFSICARSSRDVVGCGVDLPEARQPTTRPAEAADARRRDLRRRRRASRCRRTSRARRTRSAAAIGCTVRSLLYGGRIDPGKGCEELLEYFSTYVQEGGDATLMLMGVKLMPLPEDPHVRFAGLLPDEERLHALEAATVVVVPSPYESLSLLALEAFAVGTPVLANARCEVLVEHCRQSNAGLYYADRWEFIEALKLLMRDPAPARARWAATASEYVQPQLPVGRDPGEVRADVRAAAPADASRAIERSANQRRGRCVRAGAGTSEPAAIAAARGRQSTSAIVASSPVRVCRVGSSVRARRPFRAAWPRPLAARTDVVAA